MGRGNGKPEDTRNEDGIFSIGKWFTGRAGSSPGGKDEDKPSWWSQRDSQRGPTRGMSQHTGHDRKGRWLLGFQALGIVLLTQVMKCQDCGEFYRYPSKGN